MTARMSVRRRRASSAESTVSHMPTRHRSGRSGTSGDHDCISVGSHASTLAAPPARIRPPPLNPNDSADSRSFETDTKHADEWTNAKHRAQWRATFDKTTKAINDLPVSAIDTPHLLKVLQP